MLPQVPDPAAASTSSCHRTLLCRVADVQQGRPLSTDTVAEGRVLIVQVGNRYYGARDRCTHGNARLSDGAQVGALVYCPLHGGAFDIRDGSPVAPPCTAPLKLVDLQVDDSGMWLMSASVRAIPPD